MAGRTPPATSQASRLTTAAWALALGLALALVLGLGWSTPLQACPFCAAVSQTLSEEFESTPVVVLARLEGEPVALPSQLPPPNVPLPRTRFVVEKVLKGEEWVQPGARFDALYFGEGGAGKRFIAYGSEAPDIQWSTPLPVSDRAVEYVTTLPRLPSDYSRLEFFQEYLEDADPMLAADAYDEFAKTPYDGVVALKEKMQRDRLLKWINDPEMPASRKRLYFTMLAVCAQPEDAQTLETLMKSDDRRLRAGLDALIAAYLMITGEKGMPLIEELFLKNAKAEYSDTYSAIMALRFHGTEAEVLSKPVLIAAMRHMLERPELADLVIPDLARWEDWDSMPKLVELFKTADENSSWVRVPVINYLRACPLPSAAAQIEELKKIDPEAVKRANTFFSFGGLPPLDDSPAEGEAESEPEENAQAKPADANSETDASDESDAGNKNTKTTEGADANQGAAADSPPAQPSDPSAPTGAESATVAALSAVGVDPSDGQRVTLNQPAVPAEDESSAPPTAAGPSRSDDSRRLARQRASATEMDPNLRSAIVAAGPEIKPEVRWWRAGAPLALTAALALSMRWLLGGSTAA